MKVVTTGSAPISAEVLDFLKVALACDIFEGKSFLFHNPISDHFKFLRVRETVPSIY